MAALEAQGDDVNNNFITEFTSRLIRASKFNLFTVWLWCLGIFIFIEFIFMGIEYLFWGERFPHVFDVVLSIIIFTYFGFTTWVMGDIK